MARTKTEKKSEFTRRRILDAAAKLLSKNGYNEVRLEDIGAIAGVRAASIYYYFDSREALIEAVLEIAIDNVSSAVREKVDQLPQTTSYRQRITIAIETYLVMALQKDTYTAASFRITTSLPPDLRIKQIKMHRDFGNFWRQLLAQAQKAGEIDKFFDLSVTRMLLLGAMNWTVEWFRPGGNLDISEVAAQLSTLLFDGVSLKQQRPKASGKTERRAGRGA